MKSLLAAILILGSIMAHAAEPIDYAIKARTVTWDAVTNCTDGTPVVPAAYRLYWGWESGAYTTNMTGAYTTNMTGTNLVATLPTNATGTWYAAVTAIAPDGLESGFSNELVIPIQRPQSPGGLRVVTVMVKVTMEDGQ
jgi:hypothetical protein